MTVIFDRIFTVSYTQVIFTQPSMIGKWFIWTDQHVAQGFLAVPGEVAFGLPDHDGQIRLTITLVDRLPAVDTDCLWAITAPLRLDGSTLLTGSVDDVQPVRVPQNSYSVMFSVYDSGSHEGLPYTFDLRTFLFPNENPQFAILKKGSHLKSDAVLREDAEQGA